MGKPINLVQLSSFSISSLFVCNKREGCNVALKIMNVHWTLSYFIFTWSKVEG